MPTNWVNVLLLVGLLLTIVILMVACERLLRVNRQHKARIYLLTVYIRNNASPVNVRPVKAFNSKETVWVIVDKKTGEFFCENLLTFVKSRKSATAYVTSSSAVSYLFNLGYTNVTIDD
jgi:hypothetical protein